MILTKAMLSLKKSAVIGIFFLLACHPGYGDSIKEKKDRPLDSQLTPHEAVEIALSENRDLNAARFSLRQAQGRLEQAGLWPNPELELSTASDTPFKNEGEYSASGGFKQRFPIAGRLRYATDLGRVDVASALLEIRNQERLLIADILEKARGLLLLKERLAVNHEIQKVNANLVTISSKRLKVAEVSAAEVTLAEIELEKFRLAEKRLLIDQNAETIVLNRVLGRDPSSLLEIIGDTQTELQVLEPTLLPEEALLLRPDRSLAFLAIDRAASEIQLARAQRWEDWTVGAGVSRSRDIFDEPIGRQSDTLVGLNLSIPLPFFNRNQGRIAEANASKDRARASLAALDLQITTEVTTARAKIIRLEETLAQYRTKSIRLAERNLSLLQKGYSDGLTPITSVIQAQQQVSDLKQTALDVVGDLLKAKTDLETATSSSKFLERRNS